MRQQQDNHHHERDVGDRVIRVLLVAGKSVLRQAMVELIDYKKGFEVASVVEDMREANRWLLQNSVHVIILDWPLADPGETGILQDMVTRQSEWVFLAVSLYDDPFSVKQAFDFGVRGYVSKAMAAEMMCTALKAVHAGHQFCSPDVVEMLPDVFLDNIEIGSQD